MKYDLSEIAEIYRAAVDVGHPPTQAVAMTLNIPRSTAGRWVKRARDRGLLPDLTAWGRSHAYDGPHRPRRTRWTTGGHESWIACAECRHPWPCPNTAEETSQ